MTTMLYKCPGPHEIHGGQYDYTIVDEDQVEAALAEGWKLTTPEAKQDHLDRLAAEAAEREKAVEDAAAKAIADDNKPASRAELEQMATALKLPFKSNTSDKKLADMIKATTEPSTQPEAPQAESAQAPAADADQAPAV